MKHLALCLLLICALPALAHVRLPQDDIESYTKVGQKMPSFSISDLEGKRLNLEELKGKVVLVNFWATWCPPCLVEMPRLEKEVWRKYKGADFVMIAIAREQTEDEIGAFKQEQGFTFPFASDPHREVYKLFGNGGIPRSYVVGPDGTIVYQSVGYLPTEFDRMKKVIEKELAKLPNAKAVK